LWCVSTESPGDGIPLLLLVLLPVVLPVLPVLLVLLVDPELAAGVPVALEAPMPMWLDVVCSPPVPLPPVPALVLPFPLLLPHAASIPAATSADAETAAPSHPMNTRRIAHLARRKESHPLGPAG